MTLPTRTLGTGSAALDVSALGFGGMAITPVYGAVDPADAEATLLAALDAGLDFFDTADVYGGGSNEELIGRVLGPHRDRVIIATKFANVWLPDGSRVIKGSADYVREACDASLMRLGLDHIDLYYQHRVDTSVPIEETWGALHELVEAGKVRYLGISEAAPETIRRAHAVHPITALQTEWSLWTRDVEVDDVLATVRELGIGFVAYSPLGRGFLAGTIRSESDLPADDWRLQNPRFTGDNLTANLAIVDAVAAMAADKGVTPAQLALAWLLAQGPDVVPIPGTKRPERLAENLAAVDITLSADELSVLDAAAPAGATAGDRYPSMMMGALRQ